MYGQNARDNRLSDQTYPTRANMDDQEKYIQPTRQIGLEDRKKERVILETMGLTANRLEDVESRLGTIHNFLFGPEPSKDSPFCDSNSEPNVSSQAERAFRSALTLERMCDDIFRRLAEH